MKALVRRTLAMVMATALCLATVTVPVTAYAAGAGDYLPDDENPSAATIVADAIAVRPLTAVATVVGTAIFIVSLPFALLGSNVGETAEHLVAAPARYTFHRPIGHMAPRGPDTTYRDW